MGIRVDGYDRLIQPILGWTATKGAVEFKYTPRHSAGDVAKFGNTSTPIFYSYKDGNNNVSASWTSATNIGLAIEVGGVTTSSSYDATGLIVAGTTYTIRVEYNATQCVFKVDGAIKVTANPGAGINFGANIPDTMYWGTNFVGQRQVDAVFSAP